MKNKHLVKPICFILIIYTILSLFGLSVFAASCERAERDEGDAMLSASVDAALQEAVGNINADQVCECEPALSDNVEVGSRFLELLFGEKEEEKKPVSLLPGGGVFGVKIKQIYVTVTESRGIPALSGGDIILSVGGEEVKSVADVRRIVEKSGGSSLTIRALHRGDEIAVEIRPSLEDGHYRLGLTLRDGAAGLGTVTFIDPETGVFGGLGHGICDSDSGEIISMDTGEVCGVILGGVHRGESGKPGELCGVLTDADIGDLKINSHCGVFGIITDSDLLLGDRIQIGTKADVTEGEAKIISTLKNGKTAEYKIEIYDIDQSSDGSKSFRIRVTDEALKAITGGIVRGMSGSPIIQNGKLIGAVTHVLVADPTEGYGIFIENMLNVAGFEGQQKAA